MWIRIKISNDGNISRSNIETHMERITEFDLGDSSVLNTVAVDDSVFGAYDITVTNDGIYVMADVAQEDSEDCFDRMIRIGICYFMQTSRTVPDIIQMANWLFI